MPSAVAAKSSCARSSGSSGSSGAGSSAARFTAARFTATAVAAGSEAGFACTKMRAAAAEAATVAGTLSAGAESSSAPKAFAFHAGLFHEQVNAIDGWIPNLVHGLCHEERFRIRLENGVAVIVALLILRRRKNADGIERVFRQVIADTAVRLDLFGLHANDQDGALICSHGDACVEGHGADPTFQEFGFKPL